MSVRRIQLPWDAQPQEAVGLELEHPGTAGLVLAYNHATHFDAVSGKFLAPNGTWTRGALAAGQTDVSSPASSTGIRFGNLIGATGHLTFLSVLLDSNAGAEDFSTALGYGDRATLRRSRAANIFQFFTFNGSTWQEVTTPWIPNVQMALCAVHAGTSNTIFIDGRKMATAACTARNSGTHGLWIGGEDENGRYARTAFAMSFAWVRALADPEVLSYSRNPNQLFASNYATVRMSSASPTTVTSFAMARQRGAGPVSASAGFAAQGFSTARQRRAGQVDAQAEFSVGAVSTGRRRRAGSVSASFGMTSGTWSAGRSRGSGQASATAYLVGQAATVSAARKRGAGTGGAQAGFSLVFWSAPRERGAGQATASVFMAGQVATISAARQRRAGTAGSHAGFSPAFCSAPRERRAGTALVQREQLAEVATWSQRRERRAGRVAASAGSAAGMASCARQRRGGQVLAQASYIATALGASRVRRCGVVSTQADLQPIPQAIAMPMMRRTWSLEVARRSWHLTVQR